MPRVKHVTEAEFERIIKNTDDWQPVEISLDGLPDFLKNLPREKVEMVAASGSVNPIDSGNGLVYGGMDIYRHAEARDKVLYNKDHVLLVKNHATSSNYAIILDKKGIGHWTNEISFDRDDLEVISMKSCNESSTSVSPSEPDSS